MDFDEVVARRRMTRRYSSRPVPTTVLNHVLDQGRRVPSAGNSQGFDFVVLEGAEQTSRYWDAAFPPERRAGFRWSGLFDAPVLITVWANPAAYTDRYAEADKADTGLGVATDRWATPYWTVDASFAALALQYAAVNQGLGVLFFGMFDHAPAIAAALAVPADREPIGSLTLGWPAADAEGRGRSASRRGRPLDEVAHFGSW